MPDPSSRSPLQFQQRADGQFQIAGHPDISLKVHQDPVDAPQPNWHTLLGFPMSREEWQELAQASGPSSRYVRFLLCDQSPTKHAGNVAMCPAGIRLRPLQYVLTLSHMGFAIGLCQWLTFYPKDVDRSYFEIPDSTQGDCIVGIAQLDQSRMADLVWKGLQQNIFTHACAVLFQQPEDPDGAGDLAEVALLSEVEATCPGARVLRWWET